MNPTAPNNATTHTAALIHQKTHIKQKGKKQAHLISRIVRWLRAENQDKYTQAIRKALAVGLAILSSFTILLIPFVVLGVKEWKRQSARNVASIDSVTVNVAAASNWQKTNGTAANHTVVNRNTEGNGLFQLATAPEALHLILKELDLKTITSLSLADSASISLCFNARLARMALESANQINDQFYKAVALCKYAKIDTSYDLAQIQSICNQLEEPLDQADILLMLAKIQARRGYPEASETMRQAHELSEDINENESEPNILFEMVKFIAYYDIDSAVRLVEMVNDPYFFARAAYKFVKLLVRDEDFDHAFQLADRIQDPFYQIKSLCAIAAGYINKEPQKAIETFTEAYEITNTLATQEEEDEARRELAKVAALIDGSLAKDTTREIEDLEMKVETYYNIAKIMMAREPKKGMKLIRRMLKVNSFEDRFRFELICEKAKAFVHSDLDRANKALSDAIELAEGCESRDEKILHLYEIAKIEALISPIVESNILNQILELLKEIKQPSTKFATLWKMLDPKLQNEGLIEKLQKR